MVITILKKLRK